MQNLFCPRCQSSFYTAASAGELSCPYCGFKINTVEAEHRAERRAAIERLCSLVTGAWSVNARTVDISKAGICVTVPAPVELSEDDTVHVKVTDFDLDVDARVVWVRRADDMTSRAGLVFDERE